MMNKLNNEGQSLVLFVVFIPIIVIMGAFIVDLGNFKYTENKICELNRMAVDYYLDKKEDVDTEKITKLLKENDEDLDIDIKKEDKKISITLSKSINGIFKSVFNKKDYIIKCTYIGSINDDKKIIERVD